MTDPKHLQGTSETHETSEVAEQTRLLDENRQLARSLRETQLAAIASMRLPEGENPRSPTKVLIIDQAGTEREVPADETLAMVGEGESAFRVSAATAQHVSALHLSGDHPGSTFPKGYTLAKVLDLVEEQFDLDAVAAAQREGSGPMKEPKFVGTTRVEGAEFSTGVITLADAETRGIVRPEEVAAYRALQGAIRDANRRGDEVKQKELVAEFNATARTLRLGIRFPSAPVTIMFDHPSVKTDELAIIVSNGELITTMTGHHREKLPFPPGENALTFLKEKAAKEYARLQEVIGDDEAILAALDADFARNQDDWAEAGFLAEQPETRRKREQFEAALRGTMERYPELAEKVQRSLRTPQLGEHHQEGPRMDAHLALVTSTLHAIAAGAFPPEIPADIQALLRQTATTIDPDDPGKRVPRTELLDYGMLHDIAKPDSITVKVEGQKQGIELTWEQWEEIEQHGEPYSVELADGTAPIVSISYYHPSEGENGQHGAKGAAMLEAAGVPKDLVIAATKHEVAYQFAKINAATYEKHFVTPGYTPEQQAFILAASYIDTAGSLGADGKPDLGNFLNLVQSKKNYEFIQAKLAAGAKVPENKLQELKKQARLLTDADFAEKAEKTLDPVRFEAELATLVEAAQLTADEAARAAELARTNPGQIGKEFGPKMRILKPAMAVASA